MIRRAYNKKRMLVAIKEAASTDNGFLHIIPYGDQWIVKKEGKLNGLTFYSKVEAKDYAKSKSGRYILHGKDGSIIRFGSTL